jgi:hypothetical protein
MEIDSDVYGPFRSERTYEPTSFDEGDLRDIEEIAEETDGLVDENTYEDLTIIYNEDQLDGINPEPQIELKDGAGCAEIWEKMSEEREDY